MASRSDLIGAQILAEFDLPDGDEDSGEADDLQALVHGAIEEAIQWREEHLDPVQEKATRYYQAQPYGDEVKGRSQIVSTEVRDVVRSYMPSLLRIFTGPERYVEFKPRGPEDAEQAAQESDYVNYVIMHDNPGFLNTYTWLKDSSIRKMGIAHAWWDDSTKVEGQEFTGITEDDIAILSAEDGVESVEAELVQEEQAQEDGTVLPAMYDVTVRRVVQEGRLRIDAVPPEEFIWSPSARDALKDAPMVGRVREVQASELVAMGIDRKVIARHTGKSRSGSHFTELEDSRRIDDGARDAYEDEQHSSTRPVRFADIYMQLPVEGTEDNDGLAVTELRHIQAVGDSAEIVTNDAASYVPFAIFQIDPEPHTQVGLSLADYAMDLQRINSAMQRGMMDSLAMSLDPALEVVDAEVNMKDVLNREVGRVIRTRRPGMMREVTTPFVGQQALPVLQWLEGVLETRTGTHKGAMGLEHDALQSTTRAAVQAAITGSQQQIELVARILAETGFKQLYGLVRRMLIEHQNWPRIVRLRNKYVKVDPRSWDAGLDVVVNVGLGTGLTEDKLSALQMILAEQKEMLLNGVPFVGLSHYRKTLARAVELAGWPDPSEFFGEWGPEQDEQWREQQAQQQQQDPDQAQVQALVQVEMAKIQARQQEEAAKIQATQAEKEAERQAKLEEARMKAQLDLQKLQMEDAREREKIIRAFVIQKAQLEEAAAGRITKATLDAARLELDAGIAQAKAEMDVAKTIQKSTSSLPAATEMDD